jgi:hypothetical protein
MADEYDKEVNNFLTEVTLVPHEDGDNSSIEGIESGGSNDNDNDNDNDDDKKKNRFRWKYAIKQQKTDASTKELQIIYPFLNNDNLQDLKYSEILMIHAPYRAKYKGKTDAMNQFREYLMVAEHSNGIKPLEKISISAVKSRYKRYIELAEYWSDKTGPVLANGQSDTDDDDVLYEQMSVACKIRYNILEFHSDCKALENEDKAREARKEEIASKELSGIQQIKEATLGRFMSEKNDKGKLPLRTTIYDLDNDDHDLDMQKKTPSNSRRFSSSTESGAKHRSVTKTLYIDEQKQYNLLSKTINNSNEQISIDNDKKEKRKHDKLALATDRFNSEKKHRGDMLELQKQQVEHQSKMDEQRIALERSKMEMTHDLEKSRVEREVAMDKSRVEREVAMEKSRVEKEVAMEKSRSEKEVAMMDMMKEMISFMKSDVVKEKKENQSK